MAGRFVTKTVDLMSIALDGHEDWRIFQWVNPNCLIMARHVLQVELTPHPPLAFYSMKYLTYMLLQKYT